MEWNFYINNKSCKEENIIIFLNSKWYKLDNLGRVKSVELLASLRFPLTRKPPVIVRK